MIPQMVNIIFVWKTAFIARCRFIKLKNLTRLTTLPLNYHLVESSLYREAVHLGDWGESAVLP